MRGTVRNGWSSSSGIDMRSLRLCLRELFSTYIVGMCAGMCAGMRVDMCAGTPVGMCAGMRGQAWVQAYV